MGISGGPYIVRDSSLILELDAADKNSYIGSGTIWTDLSGNNYSGSLTNGPTFSSTNGGNIVFDGTNDIVQLVDTGGILATDNFTIDIWCRPTSTVAAATEATSGTPLTSGQRWVTDPAFGAGTDAGAGVSIGTNRIVVGEHANTYMPALLVYTATISSTVFSHIVITYTSKQPRAYLNGTLVRTGLTSTRSAVNLTRATIGGMVYGYFAGALANIKWYNRTLSIDEIAQNYNEQKLRFDL